MKKTILGLLLIISLNGISQNTIDNPIKNFEKLWNEFNDHYAFFELKNVDWSEMYSKYRPMINDSTNNNELFTVCCKMISELKDNHNSLLDKKTEKKCNAGKQIRLLKEFPTNDSLKMLLNTIDSTLIRNQFKDFTRIKMKIPYLNGNVIEYTDNDNFGYIRINLMFGLSKKELNTIFENIFKSFNNVHGVIIDVRFNSGGYDKISFNIAGRFLKEERIGHYKCTKKKNGFTELETKYLKPTGEKQFDKPVILLISDQSMSATDIFVLIMKDLPNVTIIGDNTKGVFSDIKEFILPNRWRFTFSTQKYLSADMKNYEGIGISPDIKILNKKDDVKKGIDPLVIKAIEVLKSNTTKK